MTDLLIDSIRNALIPEIETIIAKALKKQSSETLAEKFLTIDEARKVFQPVVSRGTIYNWLDADLISCHTIGGKKYFKYSELIQSVVKVKKYKRTPELA